ncbi:MAG TPA: DNA polymerase, partial [Acidimicrobiales bacterium]|nr:DNA polymerase [Acidimicrobiales bacterium]
MSKVLLLDGNSLAYRAFFALPTDMATASGQVTNAVFGFTSMLVYLLNEHRPDGIAVAFDRPEPTFRHEMVSDYKAGRAAAPDILRQQMGLVRQVVETLHIPIIERVGFEADDIIATLATQGRDRGDDIIIVTGDRDAYQLVEDPHVRVLYNKRGVSDYALYDEAGIEARTGVVPFLYPQYAALRGDPSDNLPGVPGVGEKTAAKLINDYGSLDGIFANLDKCTPKLRENLAAHEDRVRLNAAAIPVVRDVPIDCDVDDLEMGGFDLDEVRKLCAFLEFRTLSDRLIEAIGGSGAMSQVAALQEPLEVDVVIARDGSAACAAIDELCGRAEAVGIAATWTGDRGRTPLAAVALAATDDAAVWIDGPLLADPSVVGSLARLVGDGGTPLHGHDVKAVMRSLLARGIDVRTLEVDTALAAYLIEPADAQYLLDDLCRHHLSIEVRSPDAPPDGQLDLSGDLGDQRHDIARQAAAIRRLAPVLGDVLDQRGLRNLYDEIERPLVRSLARMEVAGVRVDAAYIRDLVAGLTAEVRTLEAEIQGLAGEAFKVNSTPQLRAILFDKLGLQPQKKTKTGFSTDAASLEKLRDQHPIIEKLLRYRE